MQNIGTVVDTVMGLFFVAFYIILFHRSLKKCFLKENISKTKFFWTTFFTNPYVLFIISMVLVVIIAGFVLVLGGYGADYGTIAHGKQFQMSITMITWFVYLIFMFLFAHFIGKWLEVSNKSLVTFVYIMFSIVMMTSFKSPIQGSAVIRAWIAVLDTIVQFAALFTLYFYDIKALSKMTRKKSIINWKLFVYPPTLLGITFVIFSGTQFFYTNKSLSIAVFVFSDILLFLFIWAFYVIIKNINSTNEAIEARDEVKTLSVEVMEALAHTIDAKDEYTRGHSVRVAKYSRMLAEKLGLSSEECENVYYMALLHDIGKIGVPNEIINSPSKLTDDEYAVVKTHPCVGFDILAEIKSRPDLSIGARWHHERFDGRGYPDQKGGEEIPYYARIIAVADSYDAMTSNRSYRKYMSQDKVRMEIENNMGTQFDPNVAKCMLSIIDADADYELHE
ncbi:MAG: HD-GYP domain-containing protein [Lachnospiraceae bacterium]|nr:HD-GYP domain-containing protein [Lachnospiraceae bacterium]